MFRGETKTHLSLYFLKTSFAQLLAQANFFAILTVFSISVIYLLQHATSLSKFLIKGF